MKLSCQEHLVPGNTFTDRLVNLAAWGYEGVELTGGAGRLLAREDEIKAALADSPIQASTICGGQTNQFIHRDQANRETSVRELRTALHLTAAVGAIGCIMVPLFNREERLHPSRRSAGAGDCSGAAAQRRDPGRPSRPEGRGRGRR